MTKFIIYIKIKFINKLAISAIAGRERKMRSGQFGKFLAVWLIPLLLFTTGLYLHKNVEAAIDLSYIRIPNDQGEVKESYILPDSTKSVIIIGERHDLIRVQRNIARILKNILTRHNQLCLIGLEGAYMGQQIINPFSPLPENIKGLKREEIKGLKEEIAESLLERGEISAVELIRMVHRNVIVCGVENKSLYERNRSLALQQPENQTLKDLQNIAKQIKEGLEQTLDERLTEAQKRKLEKKRTEVNEKLTQYLQKEDKKGIGRLYELLSDFQQKVISSEEFFNEFETMCQKYEVSFNAQSASVQDFENSITELMRKLLMTINDRLSSEQIEKAAKIQEEFDDYLGQIDKEINKFSSLLKGYRDQVCIRDSLSFLRYLQDKCKAHGIAFPSSLESQIQFYSTALSRDKAMVKNLLKTMIEKKLQDAILVVGAAHICGIKEELKNKNISFLVVIPKGMIKGFSEHEEKIYRYTLQKKALPFSLLELWQNSYVKPPPRSASPFYSDYTRYLFTARIIYTLKERGYSNEEIRETIGGLAEGEHYRINSNGIIYSLGDIYIPCRIRDEEGILRLSKYPRDIDKEPHFPVLKHGYIGKLYYEFIDKEYFDTHRSELITQNNERNIANSPLNSDVVELILEGKRQEKWVFKDGKTTKEVTDEGLREVIAGYGGGKLPPTILITSAGPNEKWSREDQAGEFCRKIQDLGVSAYITSDPKLIAKREKKGEKPIILNGRANILFIDALPEHGFNNIKKQLQWFKDRGFRVVPIDKDNFSGSSEDNTVVIIGHNTEDLLNRVRGFAKMGYFKDKVVALIICGGFDFKNIDKKLEFLKTIDILNKRGALVVTSFETMIEDKDAGNLLEGLRDSVERILKNQIEALTLTDAINKAINEKNIKNLRDNIRWDVFLLRNLYRGFAMMKEFLFLV